MPNSWLPPAEQGTKHSKEGVILIGDSWNMRHPLTGGGMTVAFNDVVILSKLLLQIKDFSDWDAMSHALHQWHWSRKSLSSTVNILSVALYDLFGADGEYWTHAFSLPRNGPDWRCFVVDEYLAVLRNGCFKYFERGGECVNGPVSLLSAYVSSPSFLLEPHPYLASLVVLHLPYLWLQSRAGSVPALQAFLRGRVLLHLVHVHTSASRLLFDFGQACARRSGFG